MVSGTMVVNAANHDDFSAVPQFAVIDLESARKPTVEWHQLREVWMVPGIGPHSAERLRDIGIRTVEELAVSSAEIIRGSIRSRSAPEVLVARARAINENRAILLCRPEFTGKREVFLDIETDRAMSYLWTIGVCTGREGEYKSFFAESPKNDKAILIRFLSFMESHPDAELLTYSGTRFDERVIRKRLTFHGLPTAVCDRMIDLYQPISRTVALPTYSYELKEIGAFFGYRYKHSDVDGLELAFLYAHTYQKLRRSSQRRKLRLKFREYNEDDVRCLPFILKAIESVGDT
jgi:predicted RecB family nuclease